MDFVGSGLARGRLGLLFPFKNSGNVAFDNRLCEFLCL